jgi:hypothetical protein
MIIEAAEDGCQIPQTGWPREGSLWDECPIPENRIFVYRQRAVSPLIIIPDTTKVKSRTFAMESTIPKLRRLDKKEIS